MVSRDWSQLCEESERTFGHQAARLYPFLRLDPKRCPLVQTPDGPGRLLSVVAASIQKGQTAARAEVLLRSDAQDPAPRLYRVDEIRPPVEPPPIWQAFLPESYGEAV